MGVGDLYAIANELLDATVEALDTIPVENPALLGAPDLRFVSPGLPAFDCPTFVAVYANVVSKQATNNQSPPLQSGKLAQTVSANQVTMRLYITRCSYADLTEITDTVLNGWSEQVLADAWATWNYLRQQIHDGLLFTWCQEVYWDGFQSLDPEGGSVGWLGTFRLALAGYRTAGT